MPLASPRLATTSEEMAIIRRRLDEHSWYRRCFDNLRAPVDELLRQGITIPKEKGYVFFETCPADNTPLRQDPFNPHDHSCPTCERNYTDEPYDRAWVTYYQSYLSQRAVDMGIVYQVTQDPAYASAIRQILGEYANRYADYPLEDCVLGPTRLFQSTYIESLWLANLAVAADFAADTIPPSEWQDLRDRLFLPAVNVIMDYDEGDNNRQAMNNVAIGMVGLLFDDSSLVDYAVRGPHGWMHHLEQSVGVDGLWYEGDNYHFATLPAMANLADAVSRNGLDLYQVEVGNRRFKMMFDGPLQDFYPDLTFPARKDSRFASPVGQRWYAGLYELAYRHYGDRAYASLLRRLYEHPPLEKDCISNAAGLIDVTRSLPANRERLDWRGFLNAVPDLGETAEIPFTTSVNMAGTGLGILRTDGGQTYASIDYGHYGGGHGHPDRLQLNFYARNRPWLLDWGTGNYYFDHLAWYRSSISHNTVVIDGRMQEPVEGRTLRFAETSLHQMIATEVEGISPGVNARRTGVLLSPDLLLDLFSVISDQQHQIDWAIHPYASPDDIRLTGLDAPLQPAILHGEQYRWMEKTLSAPASGKWTAVFRQEDDCFAVHMDGAAETLVATAQAYGPPNQIPDMFPALVARRSADKTLFAALHEHQEGGTPLVSSFGSLPDGTIEVQLVNGDSYRCVYDETTATLSVVRYDQNGSVLEASGFGLAAIPDVMESTVPLDHFLLSITGDSAQVEVPENFGRLRVLTPGVARITANQMDAVEGDVIQQAPASWASASTHHLWSGVVNTVDLTIYNNQDQPLSGDLALSFPKGWIVTEVGQMGAVDAWSSAIRGLEVLPDEADGDLTVGLTGDVLPFSTTAPITLDAWFPNLAGPTLRVRVTNHGDASRRVTLQVEGNSQIVDVEDTTTLDFPIDLRHSGALTVTASCGNYCSTRDLNPPVALLEHEYHLDTQDHIRRGERSWRGVDDLSGTFRIAHRDSMLILDISVTDDIVRSRGSSEHPFDLDSVQVYLDPRPDQERFRVGMAGVYGLLLIPGPPVDGSAQILPIGQGPSLDGVHLSSTSRANGYDLHLTIPVTNLGCVPQPGDSIGFDLIINDNDGTYRRSLQMIWSGAKASRTWLMTDYHPPKQYGVLVF